MAAPGAEDDAAAKRARDPPATIAAPLTILAPTNLRRVTLPPPVVCASLITGHQAQRTFTPIAVNAIALQPLNFLTFVTRLLRRLLVLLRQSEALGFSAA
jgi:hypothetical protein